MKISRWVKRSIVTGALYFTATYTLLILEKVRGEPGLPPSLVHRLHDDYPRYLRWIPRRLTSWHMVQPPRLILGNQKNYCGTKDGRSGPRPIPARGEWQLSFV